MTFLATKNFGKISYSLDAVIDFPQGLPGFEDRRRFLLVRFEHTDPLVFLQSLDDEALCFLTLPARSIDAEYCLRLGADALSVLGLPATRQPHIGEEVLCLAVLSLRETGPTANLLAPVVIHLHSLRAVQAVNADSGYSLQYSFETERAMAC